MCIAVLGIIALIAAMIGAASNASSEPGSATALLVVIVAFAVLWIGFFFRIWGVRIDAAGDASWQIGHCHPFVGFGLG